MGVGDYIHSKEAGHHRAAPNEAQNQSRQSLAEQAKVQVPATTLMAPVPLGPGVPAFPHAPEEDVAQGDMFDTDVEGVDESTIGGNSIADTEEYRVQPPQVPQPQPQLPSQIPNAPQHHDSETRPSYQFRHGRRPYQSNWYENLGGKVMRSAGFDSDDADGDSSQLTSVAGDDDRDEPNDWYYSSKPRIAPDEPLSKRLENFWNASKKAPPKSTTQIHPETRAPVLAPSGSDSRKVDQVLPVSGSRKITLPRSMTANPRTRFSPPKPSLLEQLDNSPTRREGGSRSRPRRSSVIDLRQQRNNGDDTNLFTGDNEGRDSLDGQSMTAFDITNVVALDEDDTLQDPFFKHDRSGTDTVPAPAASSSRKRPLEPLEPDYPPEILYQKSFAELQAEPFDHSPPATTPIQPTPSPQDLDTTTEDKFSLLAKLPDQDRRNYLSSLSMDEWEACGDNLIEQFSTMLMKMKDLRYARRETAAAFESEMKRRNTVVEEQSHELSAKMDDMRSGGAEVLRGRTP